MPKNNTETKQTWRQIKHEDDIDMETKSTWRPNTVGVDAGEAGSDHVEVLAVFVVDGVAVGGSMAHQDDPRVPRQVLRAGRLFQVCHQPFVLECVLFPSEPGVVEEFCVGRQTSIL